MVQVSEIWYKVCIHGSVVPAKSQIFLECATLEYLAPSENQKSSGNQLSMVIGSGLCSHLST